MGLWTKEHFYLIIPSFIIFIIFSIFLGKALKNKSEKEKYIPLQIITIILLALEFMKQGYNIKDDGYDLYALPFHYCSLFLYLLPFHSFYKGKYKKTTDALALSCLASLFIFMLAIPNVVFSAGNILEYFDNFSSFHTVTFHLLVCLYFTLTLSLKLYNFDVKHDLKVTAIFLAIYVIIATILSFSLKVNFHNLYKCNLAIVEEIRLAMMSAIGILGHIIYVVVLFILTILFAFLAYFVTKGVLSLIDKITKRETNK
ncbi:MAG: YwaF family protein [Clostridia bacterium]|nr:YwaF family protein [Clostridia bacterium]